MAKRVLLVCALWATVAHADPEGYQGGEGRPPGTTYRPAEGPSMTVRRVMIATAVIGDQWTCGGTAQPPGTYDLVTVALELSNPVDRSMSAHLDNFDLVIGREKKNVVSGCTAVADVVLGPKKSRIVREQFLIPRGETPEILVYNNDDFPALFALPAKKKRR